MSKMKKLLALLLALIMVLALAPTAYADGDKWSAEETDDGWIKVINEGGKTLGYSPDSGVAIIEDDGFAFKDLNRNGALEPYEDWRLDNETRARDLAERLSVEEMIPLFTHGGWYSFGAEIEGDDLEYIQNGGRGGVHHIAFKTADVAACLADATEKGVRLIDAAPRKGAEGLNIAFLHPKSTMGVLTEICENPNEK